MNYMMFLQKSLRFCIKFALQEAEKNGISSNNAIYITFKTQFPGVIMPTYLQEEFPERMTIVLENQFWDLKVFESIFEITLAFGGKNEKLSIPFESIFRFEDPKEFFTLDFIVENTHKVQDEKKPMMEENIINLDAFRTKE